jgi:tetratricopeptide (TPR) repeat protein
MAYACARQYEQLAACARRTIELYPDLPPSHWALGWALVDLSQFELAIAEFKLAAECAGGATLYHAMAAEAYALGGNRHEARRILQELLESSARQYVTPYMIGRIYAALDQRVEAFTSLEAGWKERAAWMPFLKVDPRMDVRRSEPRFSELMNRIKFPPLPAR